MKKLLSALLIATATIFTPVASADRADGADGSDGNFLQGTCLEAKKFLDGSKNGDATFIGC
jgi:hypothetical protein